ncbi:MAG: tetratricopeptide repeat protein, partial [Owenweeksia sp.]
NVELHPEAYNPWDSYGEILLKMGRREEAIEAYEKSLELNPQNKNAEQVLSGLN